MDNNNDHHHNDLDSPRLDPADSLKGFPITTTAPTDNAENGTIRIYVDSLTTPTVWRLYIRAANIWKYRVLNNT
jgi:hypothetical protein